MPSTKKDTVTGAQKGSWGELLVQRDLLREGIDSARLTSDYGIDLIAYDPESTHSFSVQVKTRTPKKSGRYFSWTVKHEREGLPDLFAFVVYGDRDQRWYLTRYDFVEAKAVGRKGPGVLRFYAKGSGRKYKNARDFQKYEGVGGLRGFLKAFRLDRKALAA